MTDPASAPAPAPKARARVPKTVWDLVFTLLIPILILSPNVLGSGISVADTVFGGGTAGNVRSYLLAALIPVRLRAVGSVASTATSARWP